MKSIKNKIKQSSVKKKLLAGGTVSMTDDQKVEMWYDNVDESELDRILREFGWKPYKFKVTRLDLDNEPEVVYPPWDKLGETYLEGLGDKLKSQLTEYIMARHPYIKKMSDPYEILNELFHHEPTIDDIIPGHIQLKSGGRVPKIQIENFIARYNLWGKDARVRFKDDTKRYFTKNIHPDRKHIFVYEENKLGDRQIRNKRIEDIVSVNERPASVYLMENGGNVKKYLLGGEIGTPEWTEQIIKDADSFFAITNTEPVGEDYVKYIQDTLKRTCTANLKTAENYYKKWLLTKESSMRNGGRFKLDAKLKNGGNIDDFAGSNKSRKFIPNKITKDELQSIISGKSKISDGDTIQAALAYIRREEGSNSINRGAKPDVEKERLIEFIGINNLWYKGELNPDYSLGRGGEHIVYEDPNDENFILKTNNLSLYGSWYDYLINLLLNNTFFPDTSYKLIGFKNEQGNILPVVRQHFVAQATIASLKDVQAYLFNREFQKVHPLVNSYRNWDLGIVIGDLHDRNVLLKDGVLFFIDTKFFISHNVDYVYNNGGKTGYFSSSEKNINYNKNIKNEIRNVLSGESEVSNGAAIQAAASYIRRSQETGKMAEREFDNKREEVKDYEMKDGGKTESLIGKTISLSYILDHKYKKRGLEPDVLIDNETAKAVHLKKEQDPKAKTRDTKIDKWYPKSWLKTVKSTGGLYLEVPFWAAENGGNMTEFDKLPTIRLDDESYKSIAWDVIKRTFHKDIRRIEFVKMTSYEDDTIDQITYEFTIKDDKPLIVDTGQTFPYLRRSPHEIKVIFIFRLSSYNPDIITVRVNGVNINSYAFKDFNMENGGMPDFENLPELSLGAEKKYHDMAVRGLISKENGEFWSIIVAIVGAIKEGNNTQHLVHQLEYRIVNGEDPKTVILDIISKLDFTDKSLDEKEIIRLRDKILKIKIRPYKDAIYLKSVRNVTIVNAEGKSDYTGKFPDDFSDFLNASKYIKENLEITPNMGYYKHTIKASWRDEEWTETIDIGDKENNPNVYDNIFGAYILDITLYYIAISDRDGYLSYMDSNEVKERANEYVEFITNYDFQIQKSDWEKVISKREKDFSGSWAKNFHIDPYTKDEFNEVIEKWIGKDFINYITKFKMEEGGKLGLKGATHLPYEISVYVPSTKDVDKPVTKSEMDDRTSSVTKYLADKFGGFTSMNTTGGYFDHKNKLVKEPVVKITSFSTEKDFTANKENLIKQIQDWSHQWGQEAIGLEFEGDLYYVSTTTKADGGRTTSYIKAPMLENYFITGPNPSFYQGRIWKANLDMITIERILAPHRFKEFKKNYYLDLMKSEAKQIIDLKMNAKTTLN